MILLRIFISSTACLASDLPTWTMEPFNCSRYERPLQVLKRKGESATKLAQLALTNGKYEDLFVIDNVKRVNAAAMFYSFEARQSWPFALFTDLEGKNTMCRWSTTERTCLEFPHSWSYAGCIVNTTFYHQAGFGPGVLRLVRNIHTDSLDFDDGGGYRLWQSSIKAADMTSISRRGCVAGDCIVSDRDDQYVSASKTFLIAIANDVRGLILVSLDDDDGTPLAYLYILGLSIVRVSDKVVNKINGFRATGACFTIYSLDGKISRIMCSSNGAKGLFEIQLPLDISYCKDRWNTFGHPSPAIECDRRDAAVKKPVVGYVSPSAETYQNDGLTCLYTPAAEEIPPLVIDNETQRELDVLNQAAPTLSPTTPFPTRSPTTATPTVGLTTAPKGSFDDVSLFVVPSLSYHVYDEAVWINGYVTYADAGRTTLNGLELLVESSLDSFVTLEAPSFWGPYDTVTATSQGWFLEGIRLELSRVDFQVKVLLASTDASTFEVQFTLRSEEDSRVALTIVTAVDDNINSVEFAEGSIQNLTLGLRSPPTTYRFYQRAVWIDGYFIFSDYENTVLTGLDLTMSTSGGTLTDPAVWGRSFREVIAQESGWLLQGLDMDIARVDFQVVLRVDDSLTSAGDKFLIEFELSHETGRKQIDLTIEVVEDDVGDFGDLSLTLTTDNPTTYQKNDGAVWINGYISTSSKNSLYRDLDLAITALDSTGLTLDTPSVWGKSFESVARSVNGWQLSGLDMDIPRVDFQVKVEVDEDLLEATSRITFALEYSGEQLHVDLEIKGPQDGEESGIVSFGLVDYFVGSDELYVNVHLDGNGDGITVQASSDAQIDAPLIGEEQSTYELAQEQDGWIVSFDLSGRIDIQFRILVTTAVVDVTFVYVYNGESTTRVVSAVKPVSSLPRGRFRDLEIGLTQSETTRFGVAWVGIFLENKNHTLLSGVDLLADFVSIDTPSVWGAPCTNLLQQQDSEGWLCQGLDLSRVDMQFRVNAPANLTFTYSYENHSNTRTFLVDGPRRGDFDSQMVFSLVSPPSLVMTEAQIDPVYVDLAMYNSGVDSLADIRFRASLVKGTATFVECNDYAGFVSTFIEESSCSMTSPIGEGFLLGGDETRHVQVVVAVPFLNQDVKLSLSVFDDQDNTKSLEFVVNVRPTQGDFSSDVVLLIAKPRANPIVAQGTVDMEVVLSNDGGKYFVDDISFLFEASNGIVERFDDIDLIGYNSRREFQFSVQSEVTEQVTFTAWRRNSARKVKTLAIATAREDEDVVVSGQWTITGMSYEEASRYLKIFANAIATSANIDVDKVRVSLATTSTRRRRLESGVTVSFDIVVGDPQELEEVVESVGTLTATQVDASLADAAALLSASEAFAEVSTTAVAELTTELFVPGSAEDDEGSTVRRHTIITYVVVSITGTLLLVAGVAYLYKITTRKTWIMVKDGDKQQPRLIMVRGRPNSSRYVVPVADPLSYK